MTRELATLRQQTALLASTSPATSQSTLDRVEQAGGSSTPSPASGRHRSASNLSSHSVSIDDMAMVSGIAPPRDAPNTLPTRPHARHQDPPNPQKSEDRYLAPSSPRYGEFSQSLSSTLPLPNSSAPLTENIQPSSPLGARRPRGSASSGTSRFEEVAHQHAELEKLKHENEILRRRVQELEHVLKDATPHASSETRT